MTHLFDNKFPTPPKNKTWTTSLAPIMCIYIYTRQNTQKTPGTTSSKNLFFQIYSPILLASMPRRSSRGRSARAAPRRHAPARNPPPQPCTYSCETYIIGLVSKCFFQKHFGS